MDFKGIWGRQSLVTPPGEEEIKSRARRVKYSLRKRAWLTILCMTICLSVMAFAVWDCKPRLATTYIGAILMFTAILSYIVVSGDMLSLLMKKEDEGKSVKAQLETLIRLRGKQRFILGALGRWYYILLTVGLILYMAEYARQMSRFFGILYYTLTLGWMGYSWFYLVPKSARRQKRGLDEVIAQFTLIDEQLADHLP